MTKLEFTSINKAENLVPGVNFTLPFVDLTGKNTARNSGIVKQILVPVSAMATIGVMLFYPPRQVPP